MTASPSGPGAWSAEWGGVSGEPQVWSRLGGGGAHSAFTPPTGMPTGLEGLLRSDVNLIHQAGQQPRVGRRESQEGPGARTRIGSEREDPSGMHEALGSGGFS